MYDDDQKVRILNIILFILDSVLEQFQILELYLIARPPGSIIIHSRVPNLRKQPE